MFLAAVTRLRFHHNKGSMFSGKIGVWPFVEQVVAQRNSRNRPKGTVLLVPQAVTAEVYRTMILDKVVPAIQAKMPQRVQVFHNNGQLVRELGFAGKQSSGEETNVAKLLHSNNLVHLDCFLELVTVPPHYLATKHNHVVD
ncbi:hypothetical protein H257_04885 [Aphanomyces astaci]|uniref:Uncharacterized protein n=1 Tax=Aphanomyces astaci TaxID=112090 RepID=W4GTG2_APHAT|nr:hypothetical protein H257_04885 [Aphanomyces astaci]ETV82173.1 hypothetical protein H257_04885 [Aphanomyces astaci]|eukprot:XP_009827842.1 hypothetical protein H257_04885 [Aphanomyces astaci]